MERSAKGVEVGGRPRIRVYRSFPSPTSEPTDRADRQYSPPHSRAQRDTSASDTTRSAQSRRDTRRFRRRPSLMEIAIFANDFRTMVGAGLPIGESLPI